MLKSLRLLAIIAIVLSSSFKLARSQRRIRTDGYYVFDNGIDTFALIPDGKALYKSSYEFIYQMFGIKPNYISKCLPDSTAFNGDISTQLFYLAFFRDGTGTAFIDVCRDKKGIARAVQNIKNKSANVDTQYAYVNAVYDVQYTNDSIVRYQVSKLPYQHEVCEGIIYGNGDSVTIHSIRTEFPELDKAKWSTRHYKFMPFK